MVRLTGTGSAPAAALVDGLVRGGHPVELHEVTGHTVEDHTGTRVVSYAEVSVHGTVARGA